ncbi:MAG TPA: PTS sugar transporter subunit IIA [Erysipelotrichaceae bacterium]|nr:PTS sugar transporter subunit IIA [Erysipelotrichaceae bacterium]
MIGICIVTHGNLAEGLRDSSELIIGEQTQFETVCLRHGDDFEEFKETVFQSIKRANQTEGVLVLVDLFGASPYNSVLFNFPNFEANTIDIRMISGVNLPMILDACENREHLTLEELFNKTIHTGKEYIIGIDAQMNQVI